MRFLFMNSPLFKIKEQHRYPGRLSRTANTCGFFILGRRQKSQQVLSYSHKPKDQSPKLSAQRIEGFSTEILRIFFSLLSQQFHIYWR